MPILRPECQVQLFSTLLIDYKGDYYSKYIWFYFFIHNLYRCTNLNQRKSMLKSLFPVLGISRQKAAINFNPWRLKPSNPKYTFPSGEGKWFCLPYNLIQCTNLFFSIFLYIHSPLSLVAFIYFLLIFYILIIAYILICENPNTFTNEVYHYWIKFR